MKRPTLTAILIGISATASADVSLPNFFSDHMILQQQISNTIWGWADPGEKVIITASWGTEASAKTNDQGQWRVYLETPEYGTGHRLTIKGNNTIELSNVAIGEVWICAGQSNMGWSMGNSFESEGEADVNLPDFRIFKSSREHWHEPLEQSRDRLSTWKPCDPESAAETSAVSYYFGKKLHQELGIPVGIIQQAFAGTPIEGWMPWDIQKEDPRAIAHRTGYDENATRMIEKMGQTPEKALATFEAELADYNALIDSGETMKNNVKQLSPPIITKPANLGHQYPGHQYNAMIYPIRPYGIRGMIWYQGERNAKNAPQAEHYRNQIATLIGYYRKSWHEFSNGAVSDTFPFQLTQLPSWNPPQTEPVEGAEASWAVSREAMRLATKDIPNTGMAVSIDTGNPIDLHPKNKKPLGLRHAYHALQHTYGKDMVGDGPQYTGHEIRDRRIVLSFDSLGSGLMAAKEGPINTFAIAGEDQVWHWGFARIKDGTVVVSSPKVDQPVAVRYAWAMNPSQRNLLYNKEGLPASPFRTDDWPLYDSEAELVEVNKPAKPEGHVSKDWERPKSTQ